MNSVAIGSNTGGGVVVGGSGRGRSKSSASVARVQGSWGRKDRGKRAVCGLVP